MCDGFQELEIVGDDRLLPPDLVRRDWRRCRRGDTLIISECQFGRAKLEALNGIEKAARPAAAPEFAIADDRKTKPLLHGHGLRNHVVLDLVQLFERQLAGLPVAPSLHQFRWPPE